MGAVFPASIVHRVVIASSEAALNGTIADLSAGGTSDCRRDVGSQFPSVSAPWR